MDIDFRLLGPVEARYRGQSVDLGSRKQRLVLAILALEAGRVVPLDRLIDLIWSSTPPRAARNTVQALVSRLRAAFRAAGCADEVIEHRGSGYALAVDPITVDAHHFQALTARARKADKAQAVGLYDAATALWRGEALVDVAPADLRERLCSGLDEARWAAVEDRVDAQLHLGDGRELLGELIELVAAHPLRQRLVGQLMQVLHRQGRASDALKCYRQLRVRLAEEFGLDPSPELARLQTAILRADPSPVMSGPSPALERPRPATLPHAVRGFVGREHQLARLDEATVSSGPTNIWVITGTAGVGKSALAVHWAHRSRPAFPDGQLHLDLRGFTPRQRPLTAAEALTQLLRDLGNDPRAIPPDQEGQLALYRSTLADRRILLLLDNARDAEQVIPLIPSAGTVLITSRQRLGDLVAQSGAYPLALDVLPASDALALLGHVLGPAAVAAEPQAAADLAGLCGYLPLALRVAAAAVAATPEPRIASVVADLRRGDPLSDLVLDGADSSVVQSALTLSYQALPDRQRRLFRLLGVMIGGTFSAEAVSVVSGLAPLDARRQLRGLAAAHLIEPHPDDRYGFHDLLRRFAAARLAVEEPAGRRNEAQRALLDFLLRRADAAGRQLMPHFLRLPRVAVADEAVATTETALSWLDCEWPNLMAAIEDTAAHGPQSYAWQLADALRAYFHHRGHRTAWHATALTALRAAQSAGDCHAQAAMRLSAALACVNSGRYAEAREHLVDALAGDLAQGWPAGESAALNNLSAVHQRLGNPAEAVSCSQRSLAYYQRVSNLDGIAMSLANLGFANWQLGRLEEARDHFSAALDQSERAGARYSTAVLLVDLGNVHRDLGDHPAAARCYTDALAANRQLGYRYGEAAALAGQALLRTTSGPSAEALRDAEAAVQVIGLVGDEGTQAWTRTCLGQVYLRNDQPDAAIEQHRAALETARRTSYLWCQADALAGLAEAQARLDRHGAARAYAEQALALARQAGYRLIAERAGRVLTTGASAGGQGPG
ncbi:BTAD domain-containing putative transcriptional regulator [Micromonospora sp. NPDC005979]|uniref:AfsR/SARP family transcriptional regulator n=1 Tax=Micromonospora sp. NPDC005979 TaxID=3156726 RepID=UPI0033BF5836